MTERCERCGRVECQYHQLLERAHNSGGVAQWHLEECVDHAATAKATQRCATCDRRLATKDDHEAHDGGCECEHCTSLCWSAFEAWCDDCNRVDWRARALAAEAKLASMTSALDELRTALDEQWRDIERVTIERAASWLYTNRNVDDETLNLLLAGAWKEPKT